MRSTALGNSYLLLTVSPLDLIAALGETTAGPALPRLRDVMLSDQEGRRILRDRPRINSSTVDMAWLATLPDNTFGHTYIRWLERCGVTPDTREPVSIYIYHTGNQIRSGPLVPFLKVHYVDDPELAYVMQRYRDCHDFYHAICSLPVSVTYEVALKFFEFANLGLPVAGLSAMFGPLRLNSTQQKRLVTEYVPWALRCGSTCKNLIGVYWEEKWEMDVDELKKELGIWDPPPAIWPKKLTEAAKAKKKLDAMAEGGDAKA